MTNAFHDPLDDIYKNLLGRGVKQEGRDYWGGQYDKSIAGGSTHDQAVSGIRGAIKQSSEYKKLGFEDGYDHIANPYMSSHRKAAADSIARGNGVNRGSVASFSDKFNADGTQRADWVDEATWNQRKIEELQDQGNSNTGDNKKYDSLLANFSALQSSLGGYQNRLNDLQKAYDQQGVDMQNQWNNMMWDQNRPQNLSVRGVRTQNELPSWRPRSQGTGFFGRGGGGNMLKTSALNI